jgi:hypothetical protein
MHSGRNSLGASSVSPIDDGSGAGSTSVYLDKGQTPEFGSEELNWGPCMILVFLS